jgi:hypothetical protein
MTRYQWIFGDATGASAIIEGDAILPRQGDCQIVTNFRQSIFPSGKGYDCGRYKIASARLQAVPEPTLDEFRRILAATHSEGQDVTLYSYIADLTQGLVYLYHFHNFENVVVFDLRKELAKGRHVYDLPDLFPKTDAAEGFAYRARQELTAKKTARVDKHFDARTYPEYSGRYVIVTPEILARQSITVSAGSGQLYFHLKNGGGWEVLPDSATSFFLLGYGGMEFSCRFRQDTASMVNGLLMEGAGLRISATRVP